MEIKVVKANKKKVCN